MLHFASRFIFRLIAMLGALSFWMAMPAFAEAPVQQTATATTGTTATIRARDGRLKHTLDPNGMVHHMQKLAVFRKDAATVPSGCTLLVGDSITHAFPIQLFDPSERIVNHGVGGMMIGGWKYLGLDDVLDVVVLDMKPRRIFMMIGINDFLQAAIFNKAEMTPQAEMLRGYEDILATIQRKLPHCKIYVEALLPLGGNYAVYNPQVDAFNLKLKALAARHDCPFLNYNQKFREPNGPLAGQLSPALTNEGIHPNLAGYQLWARLLPLKKAQP